MNGQKEGRAVTCHPTKGFGADARPGVARSADASPLTAGQESLLVVTPSLGRSGTNRTLSQPLSANSVSESGLLQAIRPQAGSRARNLANQAFPESQLGRSRTPRSFPGYLGVSGPRRRLSGDVLLSGDPATRDKPTDVRADQGLTPFRRAGMHRRRREFITSAKGVAGSLLGFLAPPLPSRDEGESIGRTSQDAR